MFSKTDLHLLVNKRLWWYQDARCND